MSDNQIQVVISSKFNKVKMENNTDNLYYCGNTFLNQKLFEDDEITNYLSLLMDSDNDSNKLNNILRSFNNSFAVIYYSGNQLFASVDRLRSYPLFYAVIDNKFYISDSYDWILNKLSVKTLNRGGVLDYFLTGYVTGEETLYNEVKQLQAGEYILVSVQNKEIKIKRERYYKFIHQNFYNINDINLNVLFEKTLDNVFERLIKSLNGKTAVIPLSGGLDSRLIATMLKKFNYKDVICFSYGKPGNNESEISRKVANKLGFKWLFVPYTRKKWYELYHSKELKEYYHYSNFYASLPHLQDWPAVKEMKERNLIPEDSVFMPGHSLDFLAGSHIQKTWLKSNHTFDDVVLETMKKHYSLFYFSFKKQKLVRQIINQINEALSDFSISSNEETASALEYWDWQERQAKFIVNSVRVYEFFGYEWRIPLWDNEIMDFFSRLPINLRINKFFYKNFLTTTFPVLFSESNKLKSTEDVSNLKIILAKIKNLIKDISKNYLKMEEISRKFNIIYSYYKDPLAIYGIGSLCELIRKTQVNEYITKNINSILTKNALDLILRNDNYSRRR